MSLSIEELSAWMEATGITRTQIAEWCKVNRNVVNGWFFRKSIPKIAGVLLKEKMASRKETTNSDNTFSNIIQIQLTNEQFKDWSLAALRVNMILTDWIMSVIAKAAKEGMGQKASDGYTPPRHSPFHRAAEPPDKYSGENPRNEEDEGDSGKI